MNKINSFLNETNQKLNLKDYLTILIIVIIYGVLSFYKLGSQISPNTFQDFKKNDSLIIELEKEDGIIKTKFFNGRLNAKYKIYISKDNKNYDYVSKIKGKGAFAWNEERLLRRGKYIKLTFTEDTTLGEIAFYNNLDKKIKVKSITTGTNKNTNLIDEKETIPEQVSYYNSSYFDEIYFARTAYEYVENLPIYEWTHPPLGKLIQAIPIYLTKTMSPFNYRLMGNISGIIMLVVVYIFGHTLFKKRKYAILPSLLLALDTFHFTQTRMGTVDSHLVLFIILSVFFMYKFSETKQGKHLFISGIFFALSITVKWTGLYAGLALAIIYFINMLKDKKTILKRIIQGTIFFVIIPLAMYYSIFLLVSNHKINNKNVPREFFKQQEKMYNYHSKLTDKHYFSSRWYTWPVSYKPVWYQEQIIDDNNKETISAIGNITIWWVGIISAIYLLIKLIVKKDKQSFFLLTVILSLWLPYALIGRVMFLYHYFPVTPFLILSIILLIKDIVEKYKIDFIIYLYLVIVLAFFIIYYPVISGRVTNNNYVENLRLFKSWYF